VNLIPVSREVLADGPPRGWFLKALTEQMQAVALGPMYGPPLPEPDVVRDETDSAVVDVWEVWDDSDYYGPHLQGICRTKADAEAFARSLTRGKYPPRLRDLYIEGVAFDFPTTEEA